MRAFSPRTTVLLHTAFANFKALLKPIRPANRRRVQSHVLRGEPRKFHQETNVVHSHNNLLVHFKHGFVARRVKESVELNHLLAVGWLGPQRLLDDREAVADKVVVIPTGARNAGDEAIDEALRLVFKSLVELAGIEAKQIEANVASEADNFVLDFAQLVNVRFKGRQLLRLRQKRVELGLRGALRVFALDEVFVRVVRFQVGEGADFVL